MRTDRIGSEGRLSNPNIHDWFNVAAFPVPAAYTYGNSSRNVLTGPGLRDWDFGLFKTFQLTSLWENARLEFRGELFNLTNTPPFGLPTADVQSPSAGQVLTAGSPRIAQFSLKLSFLKDGWICVIGNGANHHAEPFPRSCSRTEVVHSIEFRELEFMNACNSLSGRGLVGHLVSLTRQFGEGVLRRLVDPMRSFARTVAFHILCACRY